VFKDEPTIVIKPTQIETTKICILFGYIQIIFLINHMI